MGLTEKRIDGRPYLYFEMIADGRKKSLYLGPENSPKAGRIMEARAYLEKRIGAYRAELRTLKELLAVNRQPA